MGERKIFSVNVIAYIISRRPDIEIIAKKDKYKDGLVYFVIEEDVTDLMNEYKNDEKLQGFVRSFKKVRQLMNNAE